MKITYSISAWNFTNYKKLAELDQLIAAVRKVGYGIELWTTFERQPLLAEPADRKRIRGLVEGMAVSLHGGAAHTVDEHKRQIDAAAEIGARVLVVHPPHLGPADPKGTLDTDLAAKAVEYARQCGVRIALENGPLDFIRQALERVEGLGFCLDVGHVYNDGRRLGDFLDGLKGRLIHLHLQDVVAPRDKDLPLIWKDHYIPGTGGIPPEDWRLLAKALRQIDYDGIAVFEVRPNHPMQTVRDARAFMRDLLGD